MKDLTKDELDELIITWGHATDRKILIAFSMAMRTIDAEEKVDKLTEKAVTQRAALEAALNKIAPDRAHVQLPAHDLLHRMQDAARLVRMGLPDDAVFYLFVSAVGELAGNRAHYVSDMRREDALKAMAEFLIENGQDPKAWGKHTGADVMIEAGHLCECGHDFDQHNMLDASTLPDSYRGPFWTCGPAGPDACLCGKFRPKS